MACQINTTFLDSDIISVYKNYFIKKEVFMMQSKIQTQNEKKVSQPINEQSLLEQISTVLNQYLEKVQMHFSDSNYEDKVNQSNVESTILILEKLKNYDDILKKIRNLISQIQHIYNDSESNFHDHLVKTIGEGNTYVTNKNKITVTKPKSGFKLTITDREAALSWVKSNPEREAAILDYKPSISVTKAKKYLLSNVKINPESSELIDNNTGEIMKNFNSSSGFKISNNLPSIRIENINLEKTENNQSIII